MLHTRDETEFADREVCSVSAMIGAGQVAQPDIELVSNLRVIVAQHSENILAYTWQATRHGGVIYRKSRLFQA